MAEIAVTEMMAGKRLVLMVPVVRAEAFEKFKAGNNEVFMNPDVKYDAL